MEVVFVCVVLEIVGICIIIMGIFVLYYCIIYFGYIVCSKVRSGVMRWVCVLNLNVINLGNIYENVFWKIYEWSWVFIKLYFN